MLFKAADMTDEKVCCVVRSVEFRVSSFQYQSLYTRGRETRNQQRSTRNGSALRIDDDMIPIATTHGCTPRRPAFPRR